MPGVGTCGGCAGGWTGPRRMVRGVERDAGFLFGLPDGGVEDVLAFF